MLSEYRQRAMLAEDFGVADEAGSSICFVSVGRPQQWPFLVLVQRYAPAGCGFFPGILLVPEAHRLFVGAGRRLLGYDLSRPARLWEDQADCGFWSWSRHGSIVLMAAELELAAWEVGGGKLWSRFVEPPWEFSVADYVVAVDVMGVVSPIHLHSGQEAEPATVFAVKPQSPASPLRPAVPDDRIGDPPALGAPLGRVVLLALPPATACNGAAGTRAGAVTSEEGRTCGASGCA